MTQSVAAIDIREYPELLRLVEEIRAGAEPLILRLEGEDLAVITPLTAGRKRRPKGRKTKGDYSTFLAAAGGWKDVDTDRLIADIYAGRDADTRPPVEL